MIKVVYILMLIRLEYYLVFGKHTSNLTCIYLYLHVTESSIHTIPFWACAKYDGNYIDVKLAKLSCTLDDDCIAIVDEGCDGHNPFQLCRMNRFGGDVNGSRCSDLVLKTEGSVYCFKYIRYWYIQLKTYVSAA